jgi:iron complex outermembrane receptor protein
LNAASGSFYAEAFGPFSPETNVEYETGIKSEFLDRRVRLNAAVYWDDYSDLQVQSITLGQAGQFVTSETNAAKARIRGAEVEGAVIIGGGLSLRASTAYTDAHYLKYVDLAGDHSNRPFPVPKWTASASANYTRPTGLGDASIELDYAWKSAVNVVPVSTFVNAVTQPGYGLLNARANLHLDGWNMDVAVFGQNLTDKEYFDQGYDVAGKDPFGRAYDLPQVFVGSTPRTYGVELVKKFGT